MDYQRGLFERPDSPARAYGVAAGLFLLALGVLALVFDRVSFDPVGRRPPRFLLWDVSGWTTMLWIAMGGLGLIFAGTRGYPLLAAAVFGVAAVWGFIDGHAVAGLLVAGTANNVTRAALAALGLLVFAGRQPPRAPPENEGNRSAWPSKRPDRHVL
jgi:hypothetical protein